VLFIAGVRLWKFASVGIAILIAVPFVWNFLLHDYQKKRIFTFLVNFFTLWIVFTNIKKLFS